MRSIRLSDDLDGAVRAAAEREGESVSQFIRRALEERARSVLARDPRERLEDVLGVAHAGGGASRRTGRALTEELSQRRRPGR